MKLLIVDDVEENVFLLKRVLTRHGFEDIHTAHSAFEAFAILEKEPIQLVFLDIVMPEMNGILACEKIKQDPRWEELPIIMITANDESELIKKAFAAGATDYVRKPFDVVELMARTNLALKIQKEIEARKKRESQLEKELSLAKSLQRSVLTPIINNEIIEMSVFYEPSEVVGGDMYCVYEIADGEYGMLMYDVMGHGVPSALVSMSLYSLTRGLITRLKDPKIVIEELNDHMHRLFYQNPNINGYFVTAIYALINTKTKKIKYVNAGHPDGFAFFNENDYLALSSTSPFLGVLPKIPIDVQEFSYSDHLHLFFYTDGLVDLTQVNCRLDVENLRKVIYNLNENLVTHFVTKYHLASTQKEDDICLVEMKIKH